MGFKLLPADNLIGVKDGMIAPLPEDPFDPFYMDPIRAVADVYDGHLLSKEDEAAPSVEKGVYD